MLTDKLFSKWVTLSFVMSNLDQFSRQSWEFSVWWTSEKDIAENMWSWNDKQLKEYAKKQLHQRNITAFIYIKTQDIMIRVLAETSHAKGRVGGQASHGGPWRFRADTGDARTSHLDLDRLCRRLGHHVTWRSNPGARSVALLETPQFVGKKMDGQYNSIELDEWWRFWRRVLLKIC